MTDQWVPGPPPVPTPPINPLPPANSWNPQPGCTVGPNQPSIVDSITLTGRPATITAMPWSVVLNDGGSPPNFTIDHYDASGALIDHPMEISGANGVVSINDGLVVNQLQVTPGNLVVADVNQFQLGGGAPGWFLTTNGVGLLSWVAPAIAPDAPSDGNTYGRRNAAWAPALPEAPIDGAVYARQTAGWVPVSATFMPKSGGIFTGAVTFNSVVTLPANNSVVINGNAGSQRSMLIGSAGSWRWQWLFADGTAESGANAGSNFSLNAMSDAGAILSTPLAINRASGAVTIAGAAGTTPTAPTLILNKGTAAPQGDLIQGQRNGLMRWQLNLANFNAELGNNLGSNFSIDRFDDTGAQLGVSPLLIARNSGLATFGYGVTVTGVLTLAAPTNLRIGGGSADQVLTTDGAGNLSWSTVTGGGAGGVGEAPEDGNLYGRTDGGWASGGTFADAVTIAQISPSLNLNKQTGSGGNQYASIYGQMLGSNRWELCLGGAVAESGTSAGSDFILYRYDNTGAYIDIPFQVTRATGVSTFSQLPSFPGGASGQALTTNGAGALSWASMPPASTTLPLPSGVAAVGVGTTYARADHVHPTTAIGDNRIINGNFAINQRGRVSGAALAAAAYGHDRWKAGAVACPYTFTISVPDTMITIPSGTLTQVIEGGWIEGGVYTLSWAGTAQARVYQGTPTGAYAASPLTTAALPAGVNTIVEFNTGTLGLIKLEIGSVATPYNRQSLAKTMADCQRYYQTVSVSGRFPASAANQTSDNTINYQTMRAAPTTVVVTAGSSANVTAGSGLANITTNSARLEFASTAAGDCYWLNYVYGLSAEL